MWPDQLVPDAINNCLSRKGFSSLKQKTWQSNSLPLHDICWWFGCAASNHLLPRYRSRCLKSWWQNYMAQIAQICWSSSIVLHWHPSQSFAKNSPSCSMNLFAQILCGDFNRPSGRGEFIDNCLEEVHTSYNLIQYLPNTTRLTRWISVTIRVGCYSAWYCCIWSLSGPILPHNVACKTSVIAHHSCCLNGLDLSSFADSIRVTLIWKEDFCFVDKYLYCVVL